MSSLLQRMVQRARAPLPGIEPLLPARYAPQRTAAGQSSVDASDSTDSFAAESQFSPLKSPPAHLRFEALHAAEVRPLPDIEISAPEEPVPQKQLFPARHLRREQARSSEVENSSELTENPSHRVAPPRRGDSSPLLPQLETTATSESLPPERVVPRPQQIAASPDPQNVLPSPSARQTTAAPQISQAAALSLPGHQNAPALRRQDRLAAPARSEGTISDVTISIGHIEIRAEQPVPRVKAQAFRPRVSLNDFLNRQSRERV